MDFTSMDTEALTAALNEKREAVNALFALTEPATPEQADEAEALVASITEIETEQGRRADVAQDAADRFAAARASFASNDGEDSETPEEEDEKPFAAEDEEFAGDEGVEASAEVDEADAGDDENDSDEADEADEEDADDAEGDVSEDNNSVAVATEGAPEAVTASASTQEGQTIKASASRGGSVASRVASKAKRPNKPSASPVTITAAADVPNVAAGAVLADLNAVASAAQSRVKAFPKFNARSAETVAEQSGGESVLHKFSVASFGVDFSADETAEKQSSGKDYSVTQTAVKNHRERVAASVQASLSGKPEALTAAGWCAPSPYVYNWIADYTVDGLLTLPEINAPRGGLQITQGPQLAQTVYGGENVDNFGFGGTEAEAIAGTFDKTCETIECPNFVDHRLDWTGYCWKIPILTEHAYPELVTDALRLSNVLYAHKMNRRFINDVIGQSTAVTANGIGAIVTDTLEALVQVAVKERRWWNIGENATLEVKLPQEAREIFKFDMARRSGLALNDVATDQKIAAYFANHNLAVEYLSDFDQRHGAGPVTADWPTNIRAIMYPAGTFAKAVEDVINMSAVYDAASLSQNEYTGVFFEQGVMTVKLGYRSHIVTIPVCAAGLTGANALDCAPGSI